MKKILQSFMQMTYCETWLMQDQTFGDSLAKCILYFEHLRHIKQCVHQLLKQVQNLLDVRAHGWTAICAMTIQHGTEALNKNQTLNILKY